MKHKIHDQKSFIDNSRNMISLENTAQDDEIKTQENTVQDSDKKTQEDAVETDQKNSGDNQGEKAAKRIGQDPNMIKEVDNSV